MNSEENIKELETELEELRDFIQNASISLHSVNGSGIVIWVNQAELDLLGYTKEEYVGKHISNFHADNDVIEDILFRLTRKEALKNYPARLKCKNGDIKSVLINSNVLWDDDEFIHTRCFTRDISELKKSDLPKLDIIADLRSENRVLKEQIEALKKELKTSEAEQGKIKGGN